MRRRTVLRTAALALTAALAAAVQHDTFVRRWLLPSPSDATTLAKLDVVLPQVHIPRTPLAVAAARLGELAGVPVVTDSRGTEQALRYQDELVELEFRNVTLRDALAPLAGMMGGGGASDPGAAGNIAADDGRLVVGGPLAGWAVRAYDLRPAGPPDVEAAPAGPGLFRVRAGEVAGIVDREVRARWPVSPRRRPPVRRFGRFVVVAGAARSRAD
ncbi:MAG: hypothetical protein JWO31_3894, partial [Phycisphaerales bacterium]|nr:hypothetical protein [Phycisphaerales bacterium]